MRKRTLDPYRNTNILELIGLNVKVVTHTDPALEGLRGKVVDETMNMFLLRTEEKDKKVAKKGAEFEFTVDGQKGPMVVTIAGDELLVRPEDRTKKLERKRPLDDRRRSH
ncbi:MAG: ribonuclease P protein subunit [Candidatus Thermoplasmatota archaeon]|nr:ribonuclease P protein subunit [Candidatus Thermoplasmatota archaeon]